MNFAVLPAEHTVAGLKFARGPKVLRGQTQRLRLGCQQRAAFSLDLPQPVVGDKNRLDRGHKRFAARVDGNHVIARQETLDGSFALWSFDRRPARKTARMAG